MKITRVPLAGDNRGPTSRPTLEENLMDSKSAREASLDGMQTQDGLGQLSLAGSLPVPGP